MAKAEVKLELFDRLMQQEHILLHIDARRPGVSVPDNLASQNALSLKLSYAFQGETLRDDKQISSYLKFDGEYFNCIIPWTAVWGMSAADGKQTIWPEDVPKEILLKTIRAKWAELANKLTGKKSTETPSKEPTNKNKKKEATHLKRVK